MTTITSRASGDAKNQLNVTNWLMVMIGKGMVISKHLDKLQWEPVEYSYEDCGG